RGLPAALSALALAGARPSAARCRAAASLRGHRRAAHDRQQPRGEAHMTLSVWQGKAPFPEVEPPSELGDRLHRVYHQLALLPSLDPCADVDALFGELVGLVQNSPA